MGQFESFDRAITESDLFTDMPLSAQALYFHLGMSADDSGFVGSPRRIQRGVQASEEDFAALVENGFAEVVNGGVVLEGVFG